MVSICASVPAMVAANEDSSLKTITVQLKWKHQFQFAGYYMAIEKDLGLS